MSDNIDVQEILKRTYRGSLGAYPVFRGNHTENFIDACRRAIFFCLLPITGFTVIFYLKDFEFDFNTKLSVWAVAYILYATIIARFSSQLIEREISSNLISNFNTSARTTLALEVSEKFSRYRVNSITLPICVLFSIVTYVLIFDGDLESSNALSIFDVNDSKHSIFYHLELLFITTFFFAIYVLAARTTMTCTASLYVYRAACKTIEEDDQAIDPWSSDIVVSTRKVGRLTIYFWIANSISIATLIVFFEKSAYVYFAVPVAIFFSFFIGSAIFIAAEDSLSKVIFPKLRREISRLEAIELKSHLVATQSGASEAETVHAEYITFARERLLKSEKEHGIYDTLFGAFAPIALPILTYFVNALKS